jgi:hypothetical protein
MLEHITGLPNGIVGLKAVGKVTKEDYDRVFEPLIDDARREGRRLRFLYDLGPEFDGYTPNAAWEDAKLGLRSIELFDACAVVTDEGWIRELTKLAGFFMPCPVRAYPLADSARAVDWLTSLPQGASVSHYLLPDAGVIVVEVRRALRTQDFDALALTADSWIVGHGVLHGLVIHAKKFPGWENLSGMLNHMRFVRDHHRRIHRIALAADTTLASMAPRIAEVFLESEVSHFAYDELDAAIAWAGGGIASSVAEPAAEPAADATMAARAHR